MVRRSVFQRPVGPTRSTSPDRKTISNTNGEKTNEESQDQQVTTGPGHHCRYPRCPGATGGRRRFHRGQQGIADPAQLLHQYRQPQWHRLAEQAGRVGPGLHPELPVGLHPGHRRLRRRRAGPARRAPGRRRPCRQERPGPPAGHRVPAGKQRRAGARLRQPGPDRQGQGVQHRVPLRHPAAEAAGGHLQRRPPAAGHLRGRPGHLDRPQGLHPGCRPTGTLQGP